MIRIDLGSDGLARTKFAISPLRAATDLLCLLTWDPAPIGRQWRARANEVITTNRLNLLVTVAAGNHLYAPEFLAPEPTGYEAELDAELHRVACTSTERVGYEITMATSVHSWAKPDPASSVTLARAIDSGEQALAARVAAELDQFCQKVITPYWPSLRADMERDITARADLIVRSGYEQTITGLAPTTTWRDGGLDVALRANALPANLRISAPAMIFMPGLFSASPVHCIDPPDAPDLRAPLVVYPAITRPSASPRALHDLIGSTRVALLAEIRIPRSTGELADRLCLSPSTVSYHLQILHRAGLARRTRQSHQVLYQATRQ